MTKLLSPHLLKTLSDGCEHMLKVQANNLLNAHANITVAVGRELGFTISTKAEDSAQANGPSSAVMRVPLTEYHEKLKAYSQDANDDPSSRNNGHDSAISKPADSPSVDVPDGTSDGQPDGTSDGQPDGTISDE